MGLRHQLHALTPEAVRYDASVFSIGPSLTCVATRGCIQKLPD